MERSHKGKQLSHKAVVVTEVGSSDGGAVKKKKTKSKTKKLGILMDSKGKNCRKRSSTQSPRLS